MNGARAASVTIVEVGPRDGFQPIKRFIPTERKIDFVRRLAATGISRIEVGSFVSPAALPQMSDIGMLLDAIRAGPHPELSVLVPNFRGAELALAAGVENLVFVLSASETHNASNVRKTVTASLDELTRLLSELRPAGRFRFNLATAFDCPFEGTTPLDNTVSIVERVLALKPEAEICLCDTTGKAFPDQVSEAFQTCLDRFGHRPWAYHAHDTYGLGLASTFAAYAAGVRVFDAAFGGLGGCPFAPGATGNVATEDVVFLFEKSGASTGVDLPKLLDVAASAEEIEGGTVGGHIRVVRRLRRTLDRSTLAMDALLDA
jgi:hydroxymethylglutaryl-CoA lyase